MNYEESLDQALDNLWEDQSQNQSQNEIDRDTLLDMAQSVYDGAVTGLNATVGLELEIIIAGAMGMQARGKSNFLFQLAHDSAQVLRSVYLRTEELIWQDYRAKQKAESL